MKKRLLVIGSLNIDASVRVLEMPRVGETVLGHDLLFSPGGKGANQAFAAARMDAAVSMLGAVGKDAFGDALRQNLAAAGVDVSALQVSETLPTGTALITVNAAGNNSIIVAQGANLACTPDLVTDDRLAVFDAVLLQMEIPNATIREAILRASALGKQVILNPAPAPAAFPEELYPHLDWLTPNETELSTLTGSSCETVPQIAEAAGGLCRKGVQNVLVTVGAKGALWVREGQATLFPARKVSPVDTTAAGDTFHGAFLAKLLAGASPREAIVFGNLAASLTVMRKGAQASIPSRSEVEALAPEWHPDLTEWKLA